MQLRTRIAPTPSGFLHIGNAYDFILEWLLAHAAGGFVLLRIDDLDAPRVRREYLEEIFAVLHWLGLDYDAGPRSVAELNREWSQQLRLPQYEQALEQLIQTGRVYACRCSRKDLEEHGVIGCKCALCSISLAEKDVAWRFKTQPDDLVALQDVKQGMQPVNVHDSNPNFIVRRKDGLPAYHIASLIDDEAWQMNFIIRGQDLWESSATQILLAKCLGFGYFPKTRFYHHPLIMGAGGEKLSKSAGSASLKAMREAGMDKAIIFGDFSRWLDLPFSAKTAAELLEKYVQLGCVGRSVPGYIKFEG